MSFCLGVAHEGKAQYRESCRFFKRFFYCAKLLNDSIGASLALNRLGILYHHLHKDAKSIKFHAKHCEFADSGNKFAGFYNLGIGCRGVGDCERSLASFSAGLKLAKARGDLESECVALGQIGLSWLAAGEFRESKEFLQKCIRLASKLKNLKVVLDCLLILGFLADKLQQWAQAALFFEEALHPAKVLNENELVRRAQCSIGIARGNQRLQKHQDALLAACATRLSNI